MDDSTNAPINDEIQWEKQLPSAPTKQIESIIDQRVAKRTRKKEYLEYLVKWKNQPVEDDTQMKTTKISKYGTNIEELHEKNI